MFGKKKLNLDEILKGIEELSTEEKEKVKVKMDDLYKSNDESEELSEEVEEVEEEVSEDAEENGEEVSEESSENENAVEEAEKKVETHEKGDEQKWTDVYARLEALEEAIKGYSRAPRETDKSESEKLNDLAKKFE